MKRVLLLGPALAAVLSLPCAGAAEAPAARRAFAAVPGPDAEYLLLQDRYVLESDGGIVHERTVRLKINSFVAMHRLYGESRVEFDPATTAIETLHNRTVLPNGRVVPAPENAVIDDLPPAAHRNPLWSRLGRRVFVHTALEPGAVIELGWRLTHRPDAFPWLEVNEAMAAEIPIAERVVRIELPAGVRLRGGVAGLPADGGVPWGRPAQPDVSGSAVWVWWRTGAPAVPDKPNAPPRAACVPLLRVSTCPGFAALGEEFARRAAAAGPVPPEALAAVKAAADKETDWERRVLAALDVLPGELAAGAVGPALQGWRPAPLAEVWRAGVATPLEIAVFQAAALEALGIAARPALAGVRGPAVPECPALAGFERALVRVKDPGGAWRLYDPREAGRGMPLEAALDGPVLHGELGAGAATPAAPAWRRTAVFTGAVAKDGAVRGTLSFSASGGALPHGTLVREPQRLADDLAARLLPGGKAKDAGVTALGRREGSLTCALEGALPAADAFGFLTLDASAIAGGVETALPVLAPLARACPVALPGPGVEELDLTLALPAGMKIVALPASLCVRNSLGAVTVAVEARPDGSLRILRRIALETGEAPAAAFEEVRALVNAWRDPTARSLLLRREGSGG